MLVSYTKIHFYVARVYCWLAVSEINEGQDGKTTLLMQQYINLLDISVSGD